MMKQTTRVLRALRRHPEGITSVDFLLPNVIDGGRPITRVAARIRDLRNEGHEIVTGGERYGCAVYKLPQPEPVPLPPPVVEIPEPQGLPTLFDEAA
jgi:hypothetical protein